jgi:hypothetical protein
MELLQVVVEGAEEEEVILVTLILARLIEVMEAVLVEAE